MTRSIEDLVRAAQQQQAERAVDPQRILAALPQRRVRAVRRRRLVLVLAAAAVAGLVAVPVLALRPEPTPQPPAVVPSPTVSPVVPLTFSPGWLPTAYAEYYRTVRPGAGLTRIWGPAAPKSPLLIDDVPDRLWMTVVAAADAEVTRDDTDETVDINGGSGSYRAEGQPGVYWEVDGYSIELRADEPGLSKSTMLRIARSVRPDPTVTELSFGLRLPAGQAVAAQSVEGVSPSKWLAVTDLGEPEAGGDVAASGTSISLGTVTQAPAGGAALQVAGHPARYLYSEVPEAGHYLVVELGDGRRLTVFSLDLDQPAIIALAEAAGSVTPPDIGWLGR